MHRTKRLAVSIAVGLLGVALYGCETHSPVGPYASVLNNQYQPDGRLCMVGDQGCRAMMKEPPRTCLIDSGRCNTAGSVQMIDPNTGATPEPEVQLRSPVTIDAK
jgi:hypothetical protein